MPNYSDTVKCSFCKGRGHNKATCPTLTEQYKDLAIEYNCGAYRKIYERRSRLNLETGEAIKKLKPTRKNRQATCSYCNYVKGDDAAEAIGHTRRSCPDLKADKAWLKARNAQYRKNVHAALARDGYGKGFMTGIKEWRSGTADYITHLGIATKIDWNRVNIFSSTDRAIGVVVAGKPRAMTPGKSLPYLRHPEIEGGWIQRFYSSHPSDFQEAKDTSPLTLDVGYWWGVSECRSEEVGTARFTANSRLNQAQSAYSPSTEAWDAIPAEYANGDGEKVKEYFGRMTAKRSKWA